MDKQKRIYRLNQLLANYFVVYLKLHRYTWYVKGEHSLSLRPLFQAMQDDLKKDFDMLAEHILAIGGKPFATMVKFIKEASIEEASADDEDREIVEQLQHDLGVIHKAIDAFVKETDDQTTYLLYQLMATIQKYDIQCRAYQRQ